MRLVKSLHNYVRRPVEERASVRRNYIRKFSSRFVLPAFRFMHSRNTPTFLQYRPDFHYDCRLWSDYGAFYEAWRRGNPQNEGDITRLYLLFLNARIAIEDNVPGDFAELGVYKGNSAKVLSMLLEHTGKRLFLFDTFSGFDKRDFVGFDKKNSTAHFSDTSLGSVRDFISSARAIFVPGYFPDSISNHAVSERFAFVHLDCDLYIPMRSGLEYFYPRLSPGGFLVMHDYASGRWPGATKAVNEFFADKANPS